MFMNSQMMKRDLTIAIAAGLIVSMAMFSLGFQHFAKADAASLTNVSDTLSDSRPGLGANHVISYTNPSSTPAGQTISVTFDPNTSAFGNIGSVTAANVTTTGMTVVPSCSGSSNNVTLSTSTTALTFTVCASNSVATGTVSISVLNGVITNPTSTGSYIIRLAAGNNTADTRVAIVNGVNVTAAVATTFTFTVSGLPTSTTLGNGATTTGASVTTSLPFGTISPNTHYELGQQLNVTTNASNGFTVTIHEDQDMTSAKGNTIHLFKDGNATSTPSPWASPGNNINNSSTWGHIGITSDDTTLGGGKFGTSSPLYAGAFQPTTTLTVFQYNGPADGTTQNEGAAKVALRMEISPLQPAANDYSNNLIYVATPVF